MRKGFDCFRFHHPAADTVGRVKHGSSVKSCQFCDLLSNCRLQKRAALRGVGVPAAWYAESCFPFAFRNSRS